METLKQYKLNILLVFTLILSIGIIGAITLRWYEFQQNIVSPNQNVSSNQDTNVTPTLPFIEDPGTELNLGNRIAGTEETIDVYSTNTVVQDQVELVRLFIENGEVLNVSSTLMAFPACSNDNMFTIDRVCVDVAKTSPMNVNELIAKITVRWDEDQEGKIWREKSAGIYVTEDVLGIINVSNNALTDNNNQKFFEKYEFSYFDSFPVQLVVMISVAVATILIIFLFEKSQKGKNFSKIFRIFAIFNLIGLTIFLGNYINTQYVLPENVRAEIPLINKNDMVSPVLTFNLWNKFGAESGFCSAGWPHENLCHTGVDVGTKQKIYAVGKGKVVVASNGYNGGYGNHVIIQHNTTSGTLYTVYCHFEVIYVSNGDNVDENTALGMMGSTGYAVGADPTHLHFELRNSTDYASATFYNPIDIFYRQRGSVPNPEEPEEPEEPEDPEEPEETEEPEEPEDNIVCGGKCYSDSQCAKGNKVKTVECDESINPNNNKCIILTCDTGYYVDGCTCKLITNPYNPTTSTTSSPVPTQGPGNTIVCGAMDFDGNNRIDVADLINFVNKYNKNCSDIYKDSKYGALDANQDGKVNFYDIIKFKSFYNKGVLF